MMSVEIAGALVDSLNPHLSEATFRVDLSGWQGQHILSFVDSVNEGAVAKAFKVRGARLSSDLFAAVGGASHGFVNARLHNNIPLVSVADFGFVEIVLGKA